MPSPTVRILIQGGRAIDPVSGRDEICDLYIEDETIRKIAPRLKIEGSYITLPAAGKIVVPGLIDLHTHMREPGFEYKETAAHTISAAAAGGFTSICVMPNTDPVNDHQAVTRLILEKARQAASVRVFPIGAITKGQKGIELSEIGELVEAGCVAISDDGRPVSNSRIMRRAMEYAKIFDIPVIDHCEDLSLAPEGVMFEGATSFTCGLIGIPAASETIMVARDIALAELTGAKLHLAHISTGGSVHLIREAKRRGVTVTAETCPHYFVLTDTCVQGFNANAKMKPPLASTADVEEIRAGLADGTLDAIATDHAPHAAHEKGLTMDSAPFGIVGLETALPLSLRLIEDGVLTWTQWVEKWTTNPARILGKPLGRLAVGDMADLTIIDPALSWTVTADTLRSTSKNSPFLGWTLKGRAVAVLIAGKRVDIGQSYLAA